jgi:hypothetical protein
MNSRCVAILLRILTLAGIILPLQAQARLWPVHSNFADLYADSMEQNFGLNMIRIRYLSNFVYLANPSLLRTWNLANSEAAATYNSYINTIEIFPELTTHDRAGHLRILSLEEIVDRKESTYSMAVIFHELGHGHLDEVIPNSSNPADIRLFNFLKFEISPWLKTHFPSFKTEVATSELFAYYQEEVIANLMQELGQITFNNGISPTQEKCFMTMQLKKDAQTMSREEFQMLQIPKDDVQYRDVVRLPAIWVNAKDLDFTAPQNRVPEVFWNELWEHFVAIFAPPRSRVEFAKFLRTSNFKANLLDKCRGDYWDKVHGINK